MLRNMPSPLIIAHRGYRARFPENTLAAFEGALEIGAPMIELDVTLTRDRQVVVIHDETVDRTTDGRGRVADLPLAELKTLDAGAWFGPRFAGERIPTLAEVLDLVGDSAAVNIEIKPEACESQQPPDAVEAQVTALVQARRAMARVLISSFEPEVLLRLSRLESPPALGVLTEGPADTRTMDFCRQVNAFSWNPDHRGLRPDAVARMHRAGVRVFPYTVNSRRKMDDLLNMGVDGLFTDDPLLLPHLLR
jgi:glycerophosphoryl diester phosphodiesterase